MAQTAEKMTLKDEVLECKAVCESFLYFLDNYCWIEDKAAGEAIPFDLWPAQRNIIPKFISSRLLIILKARQLGLTWLTAAYCLWVSITKRMQLIRHKLL